jgi:hypothetical protein
VELMRVPEPKNGRLVGQARHRAVQADELAVQRHVVEGFSRGQAAQPKPLLEEVDAQHRVHPERRAAGLGLRVVGLNEGRKLHPRHHPLHLLEELPLAGLLGRQVQSRLGLRQGGAGSCNSGFST